MLFLQIINLNYVYNVYLYILNSIMPNYIIRHYNKIVYLGGPEKSRFVIEVILEYYPIYIYIYMNIELFI